MRKRKQIRTNQGGADVAGVKRDHHINVVGKTAPVFQVDRPKLTEEVRWRLLTSSLLGELT